MQVNVYKLAVGIAIVAAASLAIGLYLGRGAKETVVVEKKGEERVVYKDRIVTVTRTIRKDGTVTETTRTEDRSGSRDSRTTDRSQKTVAQSKYRLGLNYYRDYLKPLDFEPSKDVELIGGMRLVGPFFLELGVRKESASLGIALEF
jgi:hypothetical protein